jgi:signal transduction histidine kinase
VSTAEIEARRQLERDLHDGPQERLVLAALTLRRATAQARGTSAERLVEEALGELQEGLAELGELGRRLHPYVLSQYGLAAALEGLAARTTLPIELRVTRKRLQPVLEAAIYFTIAEAFAHFAEHAATRAKVTVSRAREAVVVEIAAEGVDVALQTDGSRLRRLADRVEALSGRVELECPPAASTFVRAVFPTRMHGVPEGARVPSAHRRSGAVDRTVRRSS